MSIVCNFDEYLGPEEFRNKVGPSPRRPRWRCGMCSHINDARNRSRCKACGAVKGYGSGYQERVPASQTCDCATCRSRR